MFILFYYFLFFPIYYVMFYILFFYSISFHFYITMDLSKEQVKIAADLRKCF